MDAGDVGVLGHFWAGVLGREYVDLGDGSARLDGGTPQQHVWVDPVPEPKTVKHRVHLDVRTRDLDALRGLGAEVLAEPGGDRSWWTMADPEGGEFCVLGDDAPSGLPASWTALVVDCADAEAQARWWSGVLGGDVASEKGSAWRWLPDVPGAPYDWLLFIPVPEAKTAKNRVHWDVDTDDIAALVAHGARVLREPDDEVSWHVLADPEGNEFCAFLPERGQAP